MTQILNFLLTSTLVYGYPLIFLLVVGSELGIPLPVSTILMAAGSFSINGVFNIYALIAVGALTSIVGDLCGYWIGKRFGYKFKLREIKINSLSVFLSRWLLLPLGVPINLISGLTNFSFSKFATMVVIGETLWATIYVYLGYLFGANWQSIANLIGNAPIILTLAIIGVGILFYLFKVKK